MSALFLFPPELEASYFSAYILEIGVLIRRSSQRDQHVRLSTVIISIIVLQTVQRNHIMNEKFSPPTSAVDSNNPKRWVGLENKTKITNKSDRDIEVFISHQEVEITFSAKGELCIGFCYVAKLGCGITETKKISPRKPEWTSIRAGETETFQLPQKDYHLTILSSDPSRGVVVHEFNRRVLSKENWLFEQKDLNKVKLQTKAVFSNHSDRDMIVILSYREVSTRAAATNVRLMGINTTETEDHTATATQIYVLLPHTKDSFNISEQSCFITTASKDPVQGYILHESNRSVACKDGYSFTQDYLKKSLGHIDGKSVGS